MRDAMRWGAVACVAAVSLAAWRDMGAYPDVCAGVLFAGQALQVALLVAATAFDLRWRIIPDGLVLSMVAVQAATCFALSLQADVGIGWLLGRSALGGAALGGGMLAFSLAYEAILHRPSVGGGDIKLLFAMGFAFGWERGIFMLSLACVMFVLAVGARDFRGFIHSRLLRPRLAYASTTKGGAVTSEALAASAIGRPFAPALAVSSYLVLLFF